MAGDGKKARQGTYDKADRSDVSANKDVGDDAYVIGVDFGTLSARALVVRVRDGAEAGTAVSEYPHGAIDRSLDGHGELPPDSALQDPAD